MPERISSKLGAFRVAAGTRFLLLTLVSFFPVREAFAEPQPLISVGATLALTGKYAFIGEAERDGLLLAVEEVNRRQELQGRELRLVIEDNGGEPKSAVTGVQKLLDIDRVDVVFSAFTHITRAVQPIVAAQKKLLVYASSVREIAEENENTFRDYLDIQTDAELMADTIVRDGRKRIAYMRDDGEVCALHEERLQALAKQGRISIAAREEFPAGESDVRSVLVRLYQTSEIDGILFCAWRDMETMIRQGKALGLLRKYPLYLTLAPFLPAADSDSLRQEYESLGAVSSWYGFLEGELSAQQKEFVKKFQDRYGHMPRPDSAYAYDDIMVLVSAALRCSDLKLSTTSCFTRELLKTNYRGAAGQLQFSAGRVSTRPAFVMKVQGGEWRAVPHVRKE